MTVRVKGFSGGVQHNIREFRGIEYHDFTGNRAEVIALANNFGRSCNNIGQYCKVKFSGFVCGKLGGNYKVTIEVR